ncbi:tripartite tricarboxylate transporter permease [Pseudorhodobacter aquimaris]|uniref:tripartite tricarboxylate transporter permease n=1 Tax=Pseudorhodobacter aquimaris TaxID=687412 RepID=UPI000A9C047C|nr:tripartite tricarboxylate transporter permease [Pseudorhodobacter aquimaris]
MISAFAILGSYSLHQSVFDVYLMIGFAFFGLILKKIGYSLEALILGLILGPIAEHGFSQGMIIGKGSPWIFFESPIAKVMWVIIALLLLPPLLAHAKRIMGTKPAAE